MCVHAAVQTAVATEHHSAVSGQRPWPCPRLDGDRETRACEKSFYETRYSSPEHADHCRPRIREAPDSFVKCSVSFQKSTDTAFCGVVVLAVELESRSAVSSLWGGCRSAAQGPCLYQILAKCALCP